MSFDYSGMWLVESPTYSKIASEAIFGSKNATRIFHLVWQSQIHSWTRVCKLGPTQHGCPIPNFQVYTPGIKGASYKVSGIILRMYIQCYCQCHINPMLYEK